MVPDIADNDHVMSNAIRMTNAVIIKLLINKYYNSVYIYLLKFFSKL